MDKRLVASACAALALLEPAAAGAGAFDGVAVSRAAQVQSRATREASERVCIVSYDPTPNSGPAREQLASARCPASPSANKGDACFCVVDVEGEPYAAGGKVAFLLSGGGYSW